MLRILAVMKNMYSIKKSKHKIEIWDYLKAVMVRAIKKQEGAEPEM